MLIATSATCKTGTARSKLTAQPPWSVTHSLPRSCWRALFRRCRRPGESIGVAQLQARDVDNLLRVPIEMGHAIKDGAQHRFVKPLDAARFEELSVRDLGEHGIGLAHHCLEAANQLRLGDRSALGEFLRPIPRIRSFRGPGNNPLPQVPAQMENDIGYAVHGGLW